MYDDGDDDDARVADYVMTHDVHRGLQSQHVSETEQTVCMD